MTPGDIADLVVAALGDAAQSPEQLNLLWQLKPAQVVVAGAVNPIAVFDGDGVLGSGSTPVPLISLIGYCAADARVMVLTVPPAGNYVISRLDVGPVTSEEAVRAAADVQSATSSSFVDITSGGSPITVTFRKDWTDSRIAVHHTLSAFAGGVTISAEAGVNINGTDYATAYQFYNVALSHMNFSANIIIPAGIPAGEYVVTSRWRRPSGASNPTMNGDDVITMLVREVV